MTRGSVTRCRAPPKSVPTWRAIPCPCPNRVGAVGTCIPSSTNLHVMARECAVADPVFGGRWSSDAPCLSHVGKG